MNNNSAAGENTMNWVQQQLLSGEHLPLWAMLLLAARHWQLTVKNLITINVNCRS
jgi:hypothetical protein